MLLEANEGARSLGRERQYNIPGFCPGPRVWCILPYVLMLISMTFNGPKHLKFALVFLEAKHASIQQTVYQHVSLAICFIIKFND
jgi:hypothetical protein